MWGGSPNSSLSQQDQVNDLSQSNRAQIPQNTTSSEQKAMATGYIIDPRVIEQVPNPFPPKERHPQKPKRTPIACQACHDSQKKCSNPPNCSRCVDRGIP